MTLSVPAIVGGLVKLRLVNETPTAPGKWKPQNTTARRRRTTEPRQNKTKQKDGGGMGVVNGLEAHVGPLALLVDPGVQAPGGAALADGVRAHVDGDGHDRSNAAQLRGGSDVSDGDAYGKGRASWGRHARELVVSLWCGVRTVRRGGRAAAGFGTKRDRGGCCAPSNTTSRSEANSHPSVRAL